MTSTVDRDPDTRPLLVLNSRETFSEDLGGFGEVVPERGTTKEEPRAREVYAMRRFLVAMKRLDRLSFPVSIRRGHDSETHREPDFIVTTAGGGEFGVEATMATDPAHEASLSKNAEEARAFQRAIEAGEEDLDGFLKPGIPGIGPLTPAAEDRTWECITDAIRRKGKAAASGRYASVEKLWLLVFDNTPEGDRVDYRSHFADAVDEAGQYRFDGLCLVGVCKAAFGPRGERSRFIDLSTEYDIDLAGWAAEQGRLAREEGVNALDLPNVAEELESLGSNQENARDSHLLTLLVHLLKWQFQPERRSRSWQGTISRCRIDIDTIIEKSPSLHPIKSAKVDAVVLVANTYAKARRQAAAETGFAKSSFPEDCPWTIGQILDDDFLPDTRAR